MTITYVCKECGNRFSKTMSKAEVHVECPVCKKMATRTFSISSYKEPSTVSDAIDEVVFGKKGNVV